MSPQLSEAIDYYYLAFWSQALLWSWAFCVMTGAIIGELKGRKWAGFALGLLLGPLGILAACFLSRNATNQAQRPVWVARVMEQVRGDGKRHTTRQQAKNHRDLRRRIVCPRCSADLYPSATAKTTRCGVCRHTLMLSAAQC